MAGLGKTALARRDFAMAIKYLESSLATDPKANSIHYPLAIAYREVGELEKAQHHLLKRGPQKPTVSDPLIEELRDLTTGQRILWIKGSQALRERRIAEAVDFFRRMVMAGTEDPLARLYLGTALSLLGNSQEAIQQYTEGLRLAPGNAKLHYNLAILLIELKSDQKAIEHLQATIQADPGMKDAHFHLANELMRAGRFEEALPHYAKVIELEPGNGFARLMQAMTLIRLRNYEKAKDLLEESHSALPGNPDITHALARLLATCPNSTIRNGSNAIQLIQSLPTKNLDLDQAETLAMAFAEVGQFGRAIELQQKLIAEVKNAQRADLEHLLAENLERYQRGNPCRVPWRDDDPIFSPVPGTLAPLDPFKEETSSTGKESVLSRPSR
jgi:tetratricopeptide (TPR) repeat protein